MCGGENCSGMSPSWILFSRRCSLSLLFYFIFFNLLVPPASCQTSAPRNVRVIDITTNSATVCWQQPLQGGPLTEFQVFLNAKDDGSLNKREVFTLDSKETAGKQPMCQLFTRLEPGVAYEASVVGQGYPYNYVQQDSYLFRTLENPCSALRCVNGDCMVTGENTYSCMCLIGYYGTSCDMFNACSRSPCGDYRCDNTTEGHFECTCPDGRTTTDPDDCLIVDPCIPSRCEMGQCVSVGDSYRCECEPGYFGTHCERKDTCAFVNCHNNGTCIQDAGFDYHCVCKPGFTGTNCEKIEPCHDNPCLNGASCLPTLAVEKRSYKCQCPKGFMGEYCEMVDACADNPCKNGGRCTSSPTGESSCECPQSYYGKFCQYHDFCDPNPCMNGGDCKQDISLEEGYSCSCLSGFFGPDCKMQDPCVLQMPCSNGGICVSLGDQKFECKCLNNSGFWGDRCQFRNKCVEKPCLNAGLCVNDTTSEPGYTCQCVGQFDGQDCQLINKCKNVSFCSGHGSCTENVCSCDEGYYGKNCENFNVCEVMKPCEHSSACTPTGDNSYSCECDHGYYGKNCQLFDPCNAKPCLNDATCVVQDENMGYFSCECRLPYYGRRCELFNPCLVATASQESICPEKFKCVNTTTGHLSCVPKDLDSWISDSGFRDGLCSKSSDCLNGGVCEETSDKCRCKTPFYGDFCEKVNPCKDPMVCSGHGICISNGDTAARCECDPGYFGAKCEIEDQCSGSLKCYNKGNCVRILNPFTKEMKAKCHCMDGFSGAQCRERAKECRSNYCKNGGQCLSLGWRKDEESFRCVCPPAYEGPRCETLRVCNRGFDSFGTQNYVWPRTAAGQTARLFCHLGPVSTASDIDLVKEGVATRACLLQEDFNMGTITSKWGQPDYSNCIKESSKSMSDRVLVSVLSNMMRESSFPFDQSEESFASISAIVQLINTLLPNLFQYSLSDPQSCELMFRIVNRLMNFPSEALALAERRYNSASGIRSMLDEIARKMTMSDISYSFSAPNLEVHIEIVPLLDKIAASESLLEISMRNLSITLPGKLFQISDTVDLFEASGSTRPSKTRLRIIHFKSDKLFISPYDSSQSGLDSDVDLSYDLHDPSMGQRSLLLSSSLEQSTMGVNNEGGKVSAPVVSIDLGEDPSVFYAGLQNSPVLIRFSHAINSTLKPRCVYWKESEKLWSSQGVSLNASSNSLAPQPEGVTNITCVSTHLTAFSFIMSDSSQLWDTEMPSVLPFVGVGFAIVGYTLTIITYCLFGSLRGSDRHLRGIVTINLAASLLLLNISFIAAALRSRFNHAPICDWVALSMHYFTLTSLLWFVADAVFLFHQLSSHFEGKATNKTASSATANAQGHRPPQPSSTPVLSSSSCCMSLSALKYFIVSWVTPLLIIIPMLMSNGGQLFHISDIYCRITDQTQQIAYYLSLAVPSAIVVIVGLCVYLFVILWIYCCKNCCLHATNLPHMPLNDGYLENLSGTANKNNCHQQQLLGAGSTPDRPRSANSANLHNGAPMIYDTTEANLTAFKKHVLSMTILLALFSATWLFAQSLDLQTFDFVFCFANVTQSWLFFSEKCILLSDAKTAWRRLFNNQSETRNGGAVTGKFLPKASAVNSNYGDAVSPAHSLLSTMKDCDKGEFLNNNNTGTNSVHRSHSPSQNTGVPPKPTSPKPNSNLVDPRGYHSSNTAPRPNSHLAREAKILENGGQFPITRSIDLRHNGSFNKPGGHPKAHLGSLSVFTGFAGSDPAFCVQNYSPSSKECLEGGDAYGATYNQSSSPFDSRDSPSVADSDPNRESYV